MTFREKLAQEHPEKITDKTLSECFGCPSDYGYESDDFCYAASCTACWSREIPMTPEEQEAQEQHDQEINAEIIRAYCIKYSPCRDCPAYRPCLNITGRWSAGVAFTSAEKQRAVLDAFEAALPPLDEDDGGRPQAAPTEDNAAVERERLDFLFWEASGKLKAWYETRDSEDLEQAVWLLRWMTEIQEGEG